MLDATIGDLPFIGPCLAFRLAGGVI